MDWSLKGVVIKFGQYPIESLKDVGSPFGQITNYILEDAVTPVITDLRVTGDWFLQGKVSPPAIIIDFLT